VDFSEARDLFGIIFQILRPNCKFLDCGFISKELRGLSAKCPKLDFSRIVFLKENPWTESTSPWTTGAPVHRGLASVADRRSSPELGRRAPRSTKARRDCTGRARSSPGFSLGPHPRWRSNVEAGRRRCSVRAMLKRGEKRREAERGAVKLGGGARLL
jgi:hypothetical protein